MSTISSVKEEELYFLILHYLRNGPFKEISFHLENLLIDHNVLPKRYDLDGKEHKMSYAELKLRYKHISPDHLRLILNQLLELSNQKRPFPSNNWTLIGQNDHSLIPKGYTSPDKMVIEEDKEENPFHYSYSFPNNFPIGRKILTRSYIYKSKNVKCNIANRLVNWETSLKIPKAYECPLSIYSRMKLIKSIKGHFHASYCIIFDRIGNRIITGSDDRLIKVWSAKTGLLLATLRGHEAEITTLTIDYDNKILASSSNDHTIRIWSLEDFRTLAVLTNSHTEPVEEMSFCPNPDDPFLISTARDGKTIIWRFMENEDDPNTLKYTKEVLDTSIGIASAAISPGGMRLATGHSDGTANIWSFNPPKLIQKLEGHTADVNSIAWSHHGGRILTGSDDGTVRIWDYTDDGWVNNIVISASEGRSTPIMSTAIWSSDDRYIITSNRNKKSAENSSLRIWDSKTGELVYKIYESNKEIYVLDNHPRDPRVFVSAGYDGKVMYWNIETGERLSVFETEPELKISFCDGKFSPNGDLFVTLDNEGSLWIFGIGDRGSFSISPNEQFLQNDYAPFVIDTNGFIVDEATNLPIHLVPRQSLCNRSFHPYDIQPQIPPLESYENFTEDDIKHQRKMREKLRNEEINTICNYIPIEPKTIVTRSRVNEAMSNGITTLTERHDNYVQESENNDLNDMINFEASDDEEFQMNEDEDISYSSESLLGMDLLFSESSNEEMNVASSRAQRALRRMAIRERLVESLSEATPTRRSTRKRKRTRNVDDEFDSSDDEVVQISSTRSRPSASRNLFRDNEIITFQRRSTPRSQTKRPNTNKESGESESTTKRSTKRHKVKKIYYEPSIGDEIVYFKTAHNEYVELYSLESVDIPEDVPDIAFCRIENIEYESGIIAIYKLTLSLDEEQPYFDEKYYSAILETINPMFSKMTRRTLPRTSLNKDFDIYDSDSDDDSEEENFVDMNLRRSTRLMNLKKKKESESPNPFKRVLRSSTLNTPEFKLFSEGIQEDNPFSKSTSPSKRTLRSHYKQVIEQESESIDNSNVEEESTWENPFKRQLRPREKIKSPLNGTESTNGRRSLIKFNLRSSRTSKTNNDEINNDDRDSNKIVFTVNVQASFKETQGFIISQEQFMSISQKKWFKY